MLQFLQRIFNLIVDSRSDLERYVDHRQPQNAADIEHIMRDWAHNKGTQWL